MGSLKRAKERRAWLGAVSRQYRDGWGRALVSMGADFSASEWASMSGLPEEAIRWILLVRREDLEDE